MQTERTPENPPPLVRRILSKRQVLALVPVSYTTIWQWMRQGEFPRSVVLGPGGNIGWHEDAIAEWLESREPSTLKPLAATEAA